MTIRSTLRGVGEGFAEDKDYIVPEQCLNDDLVDELQSIIDHTIKLHGFDKLVSQTFYVFRIGAELYFKCDTFPFVYDLASICFLGHCNFWSVAVNISKNQLQALLLLMQSLNILRKAIFRDLKKQPVVTSLGYDIGVLFGSSITLITDF